MIPSDALDLPADNPFAEVWRTPFGLPPFAAIRPEHIEAAFTAALDRHKAEIAAITAQEAAPDFANTIEALERAGRGLSRVGGVFYNLAGADTNEALQALERQLSPVTSRHWSAVMMDEALFARVDAVHAQRESVRLDPEQARLLDRWHRGFVRSGARLGAADKARLASINERLAELGTRFGQNVLKDESSYQLLIADEAGLAGLPDFLKDAMARAAADRGHAGQHAVTLSRSIIEPFLTFSTRRDLREQALQAWSRRGENGGETDNTATIAEMVALRAEKAKLLGFTTFAHFKLDDTMAKTPDQVRHLLELVWAPARRRAEEEARELSALAAAEGADPAIRPWDWRHYAEKVRRARFALDEAQIKPYLQLDRIIDAAFSVAGRLFGLAFTERRDLVGYHPDVRIWEVSEAASGRHVGLFLGDYFSRSSKRSGAWMSAYRGQRRLDGEVRPIIVNVCNFAKPGEGEPALLSIDDARTLFHEFGHALHGLLSDVTYGSLAGTSVSRDFVELPSQLYEHWFLTPEVMQEFCRHAQTGEPIPEAMIETIRRAQTFNQGFATVEYTSSALVDLAFHSLESAEGIDPAAFERAELGRIGMPAAITMRHRSPHFTHVFSGDGYSAGYYSYLWSEVMDADAFNAFLEAGNPFDAELAGKLKRYIYSAGDTRDAAEAYTLFRGRLPMPDALLDKRGLAAA